MGGAGAVEVTGTVHSQGTVSTAAVSRGSTRMIRDGDEATGRQSKHRAEKRSPQARTRWPWELCLFRAG